MSTANTDEGRQKHTPTMDQIKWDVNTAIKGEPSQKHTLSEDKEAMGGVSAVNTDERRQKHAHPRDQETKVGGECSKHEWGRTKAHTS